MALSYGFRTSWCALSCYPWLCIALSQEFVMCALSCYPWLYMTLSYDFVICAIMLLLNVHGVVLWHRDMCFHATLDCAWRCLRTSWYVLLCYPWLCISLSQDFVICSFMLLWTVHGVVLGLLHVCYMVTFDRAWRCLRTSRCALSCYFGLLHDNVAFWLRDLQCHVTPDCAWRYLRTSSYVLIKYRHNI